MKLLILFIFFISTSVSAKSVYLSFTKEIIRGEIIEAHYAKIQDYEHSSIYNCSPKAYPDGLVSLHGSGAFDNEIYVTIMSYDGKFRSVSNYINYYEDKKVYSYHHHNGVLARLSLISESEFVRMTGDISVALPLLKDHNELYRNVISNDSWFCDVR